MFCDKISFQENSTCRGKKITRRFEEIEGNTSIKLIDNKKNEKLFLRLHHSRRFRSLRRKLKNILCLKNMLGYNLHISGNLWN